MEKVKGEEIEKLKAEVAALKTSTPTQQLNRPKPADFQDKDDPEMAYSEAMMDWKIGNQTLENTAKAKKVENDNAATQRQRDTDVAVDNHYERAAKLGVKGNITPELYQSSDLKVRQAIETVYPEAGDYVTEMLISNLGEGSEKVFYNLGVNSTRLSKLQSLLTQDPSGLKAGMYLGELKNQLSAPQKRTTNAPDPASTAGGDQASNSAQKVSKKTFDKLVASNDVAGSFAAKMTAKASGVDVSTW